MARPETTSPPARVSAMLGNDLVVNEDSCNLSCAYCLTGQSNLKDEHREKRIFSPPRLDSYRPGEGLGQRLHTILERVGEGFRPPLLKITGGEVFLVQGILDFVAAAAATHEVVVVQTNAALVKADALARLKSLGNLVLQISLDGHSFEYNRLRTPTERLHDTILGRIANIIESGVPVEIYCVLTQASIGGLEGFAEWCMGFANRPTLFPFPIRGPAAPDFAVAADEVQPLERLLARYDQFEPVLPPRAYLERLLAWYRHGRTFACHLPRLVLSTFSDGVLTSCPNIWFNQLGNLLGDDWLDAAVKVGKTPFYQLLLAKAPRLDACKRCFTPWDTLSLYFDDIITLDELARTPSYAPPAIRRLLANLKEEVRLAAE